MLLIELFYKLKNSIQILKIKVNGEKLAKNYKMDTKFGQDDEISWKATNAL